ncbi:hypothetical protein K435DRAFT_779123 [Dendrothele bispora CBS 962.96]|uniref:Histone H2A C-terminal domain-containing protein n=1 Tax=Dendrothele bispora (strain CBS 962.96) TaxID=1314807 RepID=A0A4V4HFK5_DENBC|nr:hypothetical protein K435DRAFT_779123 [Dendrothele bispora CBS 962.96]
MYRSSSPSTHHPKRQRVRLFLFCLSLYYILLLSKLLGDVFISEDSVVPQIESQLLPTKSGKGKKNEDLSQEV